MEYFYLKTNFLSQSQILHELGLDIIQEILIAIIVAIILTITFEPQTRGVIDSALTTAIADVNKNTNKIVNKTVEDGVSQVTKKTHEIVDQTVKNAVNQVTKKTIDHMLSDFSGNRNIYNELKSCVFNQPFVRRNHYTYIWIEWLKDKNGSIINRDFVSKRRITRHEVTNSTLETKKYEIIAFEDTIKKFIEQTKIVKIKICPKSLEGTKEEQYFTSNISDFNNNLKNEQCLLLSDKKDIDEISHLQEDNNLHLGFDISVNPGITMIIEVETEAFSKSDYEYTFVMTQVTDGMDLEIVHHALDLDVKVQRLHPNKDKFREIINKSTHKHYRIDTGVLPFQGMVITWSPHHPLTKS